MDFANKEKITELLYPLFVHNIGALLYHPTNQSRTSQVMAAAERRKQEQQQGQQMRTPPAGLPSIQHQPHPMGLPGPQSLPSNNIGRPPLDRAATFPTPPASASGVMPNMTNSEGFNWQGQGMNGAQGSNPMPMDANMGHARSMPTTPTTTPPGSMQPYPSATQGYDSSRQMYSAPSSHHSPYPPATNGDRMYGQGTSYAKNEMGPPSTRPAGPAPSGEHDAKGPNGILPSEHAHQPHAGEEDGDQEHDGEYTHDSGAYESNRSYSYTAPGVGALAGDAANVDPSMTGSPSHPPASGRATPRSAAQPQPYYPHSSGYGASPRVQQAPAYYNGVGGDRPVTNGASGGDVYGQPADMTSSMPNGYSSQPPLPNGAVGGVKRGRDDDELPRPMGDIPGMDLKRRKTMEASMPAPPFDSMGGRPAPAVGGDPRHR